MTWFHPGGFDPPNNPAKEPRTAAQLNHGPKPPAKNQAHPNHRTKCRWPTANRTPNLEPLNLEPLNPEPPNHEPASQYQAHSSRPAARGSVARGSQPDSATPSTKNPLARPRPSLAPPCPAIASPCAAPAPPCAACAQACAPCASPCATPHNSMRGLRPCVRPHCAAHRTLRGTVSTSRPTISAFRGTMLLSNKPRNALRIRHTCHYFRSHPVVPLAHVRPHRSICVICVICGKFSARFLGRPCYQRARGGCQAIIDRSGPGTHPPSASPSA